MTGAYWCHWQSRFTTAYLSPLWQNVCTYLPAGFRPGALGLPTRVEVARACSTRLASSSFGTFRSCFMMPLNRRSSGDSRNCWSVIGGECVSPSPCRAFDGCRRSTMARIPYFLGKLRIEVRADDLTHRIHKSLRTAHVKVVIPKKLLINIPEQLERLDGDVGVAQAPLQERPEVHVVDVRLRSGIPMTITPPPALHPSRRTVRLRSLCMKGCLPPTNASSTSTGGFPAGAVC